MRVTTGKDVAFPTSGISCTVAVKRTQGVWVGMETGVGDRFSVRAGETGAQADKRKTMLIAIRGGHIGNLYGTPQVRTVPSALAEIRY